MGLIPVSQTLIRRIAAESAAGCLPEVGELLAVVSSGLTSTAPSVRSSPDIPEILMPVSCFVARVAQW